MCEIVSEILRIETVEAQAQLVGHIGGERVVVTERGVVVARLCIHVADLDKTRPRRGRGEVAALIRLAGKDAVVG